MTDHYDPALGRFIQADTIVPEPGNPQSLNRYAYTLNNPLRYTDPTGHFTDDEIATAYGVDSVEEIWWWDDPAYVDWKHILQSDATWGDILVAQVNGHTYSAMFVQTATSVYLPSFGWFDVPTGGIILHDLDLVGAQWPPELVKDVDLWKIYRSETSNFRNYKLIDSSPGVGRYDMPYGQTYQLPATWNIRGAVKDARMSKIPNADEAFQVAAATVLTGLGGSELRHPLGGVVLGYVGGAFEYLHDRYHSPVLPIMYRWHYSTFDHHPSR